jgi:hypothetical protein
LEDADENVLVDLGAEIADKDGVLGATLVAAAVGKATTRSPIKLEGAVRVGDEGAVQLKGLGCGVGRFKVNEAVSGITASKVKSVKVVLSVYGPSQAKYSPREFIANHLDVDLVAHAKPDASDKVLVNPRLKLTHPAICLS